MIEKIFVSIPAWEDTELIDTMKKCLKAATSPENIVFGLGINYENEPDFSEFTNKIIIVRDKKDYDVASPGIVQVRHKIRSLITDEKYFLSIDAHADFANGWDIKLISDINDLSLKGKYVISKQIMGINDHNDYITKWKHRVFGGGRHLEIIGEPKLDNNQDIKRLMVNDKYFLNKYTSANFIFAKSDWAVEVEFPNYHGFPLEEPEMSLVTHCNGFDVVSPLRSESVIFAGNDPKTMFPYDEKWWTFHGTDRNNPGHWSKKWVFDTNEIISETEKLMITGENSYFSVNGLSRTINSFYESLILESNQ